VVFGDPRSEAGKRTVDVPAELVEILSAHLAEHVDADPEALVFTSPEGHPLRRTKFRLRWAEACRGAGITGLHSHDQRGSGAT
jgi:integrase